jgi:hypothetical protein
MVYKHILHKLDCECGFEMFVFDREKSGEVKPWQLDTLRNAAKEMIRQFIDSGETKTCPKCERRIDLDQTPAEKYRDDGEKLSRIG